MSPSENPCREEEQEQLLASTQIIYYCLWDLLGHFFQH